MNRVVAMCMALGLLPLLGRTAEPSSADEDFLEYLAEFDIDDDWIWWVMSDDVNSVEDSTDGGQRTPQPPVKRREETKP